MGLNKKIGLKNAGWKFFLLLSLLVLCLPPAKAVDACDDNSVWWAGLNNDTDNSWIEYVPRQYFSANGAILPDYDENNSHQHAHYEMNGTACHTSNFTMEFKGYFVRAKRDTVMEINGTDTTYYLVYRDSAQAVCGFYYNTWEEEPVLKSSKLPKKVTLTVQEKPEKNNGLKAYAYASFSIKFVYRNDTLFKYSNGYLNGISYPAHICNILNPMIYWAQGGGWPTSLTYTDNDNGTGFTENFNDCQNISTFAECEPTPIPTIEGSYLLPNCTDSTLTLMVKSDLLTDFTWKGPNGFKASGDTILLNYSDYEAGRYIVYGRLSPCDEYVIDTLDITKPQIKFASEQKLILCHGNQVKVGEHIYEETGIYIDTLKTTAGCDSIVTSDLTFEYIANQETASICKGSSYDFNGTELTEAGTYTDTLKTDGGCDSIVTLTLETYQLTGEEKVSICKGSSFDFNGTALTQAGTYIDTLKTDGGCDSIVTLTLETYQLTGEEKVSICKGSSYDFNGTTLTQAGTYIDTLKTDGGCDSIVTLTLETYQITGEEKVSICKGSSYNFNGTELTEAGTYIDTLKTDGGCDSIVTLTLEIYQITGEEKVSICKGSSYNFNGTTLTQAGTYIDTLKTLGGCDSIVTLTLETYQITGEEKVSICKGSSYDFNGKTLTQAGTYIDTLKTLGGCDSIVTLTLETYQVEGDIFDTICSGQKYLFNEKELTQSGTYTDTLKTNGGCDSLSVLHLTVMRPIESTSLTFNLCTEDSLLYNGNLYKKPGIYKDTLSTLQGCDSIIRLRITRLPQADTLFGYDICANQTIEIDGKSYGQDTIFTTLQSFAGYECKVKTTYRVKTHPLFNVRDKVYQLCGRHTLNVVLDSIKNGSYEWIPATGVSDTNRRSVNIYVKDSITYRVALQDAYCTDTISVKIKTTPKPEITAAGCDEKGDNLYINVINGTEPYTYGIDTMGDWHSSVDFAPVEWGVHIAYVKDEEGCIDSAGFHYFIPVIPAPFVTPNGDGIKDVWEIKNIEYYKKYSIKIFDRWGKLLKEYENEYTGWDGTYNGNRMPTTDYWYTISIDGWDQDLNGHFTLLRQ